LFCMTDDSPMVRIYLLGKNRIYLPRSQRCHMQFKLKVTLFKQLAE